MTDNSKNEQTIVQNDFSQPEEKLNDFTLQQEISAEEVKPSAEAVAEVKEEDKPAEAAAEKEEAEEKPEASPAEAAAESLKPQSAAAEFLAAAQKSQIAAFGAQKNGEKAFYMAQKVLEEYCTQPTLQENVNEEAFLHKQLMAVRDSINALNNSLAAEKVGVQLSEEAVKKATREFDSAQRESDGAQVELQRLQKLAQQQEGAYNALLQKQKELNARIKLEEEKLKVANAASLAAKTLLDDIDKKKEEAAELLREAQAFDKDTRDRYRKLQLSFSQAREDASAIITQLSCLNKKLPFDMEEMLLLYEEGYDTEAGCKPKKKLFGKNK